MKKITFSLLIIFTLNGCVKKVVDPLGGGCVLNAAKYSETILAFSSDPTNKKKCEAYVDAIKAYVKNCSLIPASEKKDIDNDLKDLNCSNLGN